MKNRWIGNLMIVIILGSLLAACSTDSKEPANEQDALEAENETGGDLNIAVTAQPPTLDTHLTTATIALQIGRNIFETLVTQNETYEAVPMLAESIENSEDGLTYTFNLRQDVKFHNGKEMTSEDVVASMNRWLEQSSRAKMLLSGAVFEAEDSYTVILTLENRASDVLDIMAGQGQFPAIMPKEVIESASEDGINEYIGTGPFQFEEWRQDQYIHLVKYEDYQSVDGEPSGLAGKKEVLVDNLYYQIVTDSSTRIAGLQTGEYDVAEAIAPDNYEQLKSMSNVDIHLYLSGSNTMFYNKKEGIMTDRKMRQAINAILDMDEIMLASFANEDLYVMDPGYMSPDQTNWSSDAGSESFNQKDLEKGKKLLEEANYNGEEIRLVSTRDYDYNYNAAIVVKEQLEQAGVNVNLEVYDWTSLLEHIADPENWDIRFVGIGYVTTPSQLLPLSASNPGWPDDEKVTALLDEIRGSATQADAENLWDELQAYLWNDYVPISLFGHYSAIIGAVDNLEGFKTFQGSIPWNTKVIE
ncbi:ABC transporter substrate-binding protein [Ornithinibacillus sp. 4-3]|uniref:ABC transporter substrate-binding protein n=1 Tax=Ornithinibacillus sp. 4-3 TaxID=3231488 RepID=A0AB39HMI9_9BACI